MFGGNNSLKVMLAMDADLMLLKATSIAHQLRLEPSSRSLWIFRLHRDVAAVPVRYDLATSQHRI